MKIGIIDYGAGNLHSIAKAIRACGIVPYPVEKPVAAAKMDKLILPGVGHFRTAARRLRDCGFYAVLRDWHHRGKPLLGICLGMQLMFEGSEEAPEQAGLGIISGNCRKMTGEKIPHIGWNRVYRRIEDRIFERIPDQAFFYFVHAYAAVPADESKIIGKCTYSGDFPALVKSGRSYGMQFHPEKSGATGLRILGNWLEEDESC